MANYLSIEKRKRIFHLLVEGNGVRGVSRLIGCSINSIVEIQKRYYFIADFLNRKNLVELNCDEIEADEIRSKSINAP